MEVNEPMKTIKTILLIISGLVLLQACLFPDDDYLMELNRTGKWKQAESIGLDMLNKKQKFSHSDISATYFHVIYAKTRLGKKSEAVMLMNECDDWIHGKSLDSERLWLKRELFMLKDELGMLTPVQKKILEAMNANAAGEYESALALCSEILSLSERTDLQNAYVYFIATVCSLKLEHEEDALKYIEQYGKYRMSLPSDDPLRFEEHNVYTELGFSVPGD